MSPSGFTPSADIASNRMPIFIPRPPNGAPVLRGAFSLENPADRDTLPRGRQLQTALNELVVAHPVRTGCFWKAGVVRGIGKYSWKRIDLDHIRLSVGVEPDVYPRPVAAAKYAIRFERDALDFSRERFI